jgi:NOL1/NOP2/fmu family ribosome biogenesis protein
MHNLKFLNNKEIKNIAVIIKKQWNAQLPEDYFFLLRKDGDLFMVNRNIKSIDLSQLKINSIGLYVGELRNNALRLSIEGSQLIGPSANKNVVKIDKTQLLQWLRGEDLEIITLNHNINHGDYIILKHKKDFVGCGKLSDNKILNFVPKARRVRAMD